MKSEMNQTTINETEELRNRFALFPDDVKKYLRENLRSPEEYLIDNLEEYFNDNWDIQRELLKHTVYFSLRYGLDAPVEKRDYNLFEEIKEFMKIWMEVSYDKSKS